MRKVSVNELAILTDIARQTITRRIAHLPTEPGAKSAKLVDSAQALRVIFGTGNGDERLDPGQERAMLDKRRRQEVELRIKERTGDLIEAGRVVEIWRKHIETAKGRLLAIPGTQAAALFRAESIADVEQILRDALMAVMEEIADAGVDEDPGRDTA